MWTVWWFWLGRRNVCFCLFFFSSRRRHTRSKRDWSSDVCSSDLGPQGGEALGARRPLEDGQEDGCAAADPGVTAQPAAQLDTRQVGEVGIGDDHVWLRGAGSLQRTAAATLLEHRVAAGLKQALEPLRGLLPIADQECQRQFGLRDSIAHLGPPKTAWSVSPQTRGHRHAA